MRQEAIDYLHQQNIETLDILYADLLRLARQGTPDAVEQLQEIVALRARITGDNDTLDKQQQEIAKLARG